MYKVISIMLNAFRISIFFLCKTFTFYFIFCRLKDNHEIAHTGMAILEVGMLSGVSLFSGAAVQADFVRRVDIGPERVSLYLTSVSS